MEISPQCELNWMRKGVIFFQFFFWSHTRKQENLSKMKKSPKIKLRQLCPDASDDTIQRYKSLGKETCLC